MNRRHDRNAEVDGAPVVLHAEAAILRNATFGNVELAHDFDTGNNGRVMLFADRRHGVGQNTVDAELDTDRVVLRLDVDVARPPLKGGKNRGIDQANNRAHVARRSPSACRSKWFRRARPHPRG